MPTYPSSPRSAFRDWCQAHAPVFTQYAAQIGLSVLQAQDFADSVSAVETAEQSKKEARSADIAATQVVSDAYVALREEASDVVNLIRTFAENSSDPTVVYNLAQIPPPASPTPIPPPGQPTDMKITLDPDGDLTLRWKCTNPPGASGTSYIVRRKVPGQTTWEFIGVTGSKKFTDSTLVAGPDWVQYQVQGQRSDLPGPVSDTLLVSFGQAGGGGGGFTITSQTSAPMSQAA
jgi:hypothetical protein